MAGGGGGWVVVVGGWWWWVGGCGWGVDVGGFYGRMWQWGVWTLSEKLFFRVFHVGVFAVFVFLFFFFGLSFLRQKGGGTFCSFISFKRI